MGMSTRAAIFHTARVEQRVIGPPADLAAIAYSLQYTRAQVEEYAAANPPAAQDAHLVGALGTDLVRVNLYGHDPVDPERRICAIGLGDDEEAAHDAAARRWMDFHAGALFTSMLDEEGHHTIEVRHRVPGAPAQRAATIDVGYALAGLKEQVGAAVERNLPTGDEVHVVQAGEHTLMRVSLFGRHPFDSGEPVCVAGIADRHYRAMAAAEEAWRRLHTSLLFAAQALGSA